MSLNLSPSPLKENNNFVTLPAENASPGIQPTSGKANNLGLWPTVALGLPRRLSESRIPTALAKGFDVNEVIRNIQKGAEDGGRALQNGLDQIAKIAKKSPEAAYKALLKIGEVVGIARLEGFIARASVETEAELGPFTVKVRVELDWRSQGNNTGPSHNGDRPRRIPNEIRPIERYVPPNLETLPQAKFDLTPLKKAGATFYANVKEFEDAYLNFGTPLEKYNVKSRELSNLKDQGASDGAITRKTQELTAARQAAHDYVNKVVDTPKRIGYLETSRVNFLTALNTYSRLSGVDTSLAAERVDNTVTQIERMRGDLKTTLGNIDTDYETVTAKSTNKPDKPITSPTAPPEQSPPPKVDDPKTNPVVTRLFIAENKLNAHLNKMNIYMNACYGRIALEGPAARSSPKLKEALNIVGNSKANIKNGLAELNTILRQLPSGAAYEPYRNHARLLIKNFDQLINGEKNDGMAPWLTGMQRFISDKGDVPVTPSLVRTSDPKIETSEQMRANLEAAYDGAVNAMKPDSPQSKDAVQKQLASLEEQAKKITADFSSSNSKLVVQVEKMNRKLSKFDTAIAQREAQKKPDDGSLKKLLSELNNERGQDPTKTVALFTAYGRLNDLKAKKEQLNNIAEKMQKIQVDNGLPVSTLKTVQGYQRGVASLLGSESKDGSIKVVATAAQDIASRQQALDALNKTYDKPNPSAPDKPSNPNAPSPNLLDKNNYVSTQSVTVKVAGVDKTVPIFERTIGKYRYLGIENPSEKNTIQLLEIEPVDSKSPQLTNRLKLGTGFLLGQASVYKPKEKSVAEQFKHSLSVNSAIYFAVGLQRPTSLALGAGKKAFEVFTSKFPGLGAAISKAGIYLDRGDPDKEDVMRLEFNIDPRDGSSVLHVKFNLSQMMKLPRSLSDRMLDEFKNTLTDPEMRKTAELFRAKVNTGRDKGLANTIFAERTDLRLSFDVADGKPRVRVGALWIPTINKIPGGRGFIFVTAISPRAKFSVDPNTRLSKFVGGQIVVAVEVDTPTSEKTSLWGGFGAGAVLQWNGGIENSPVRKDAKGNVGIEIEYKNEVRFLATPNILDILKMNGFPDAGTIKTTSAQPITGQEMGKDILNINDPKVLQKALEAVKKIEDGAQIAETAKDVTVGVSSTFTLAGGLAALSPIALGVAAAGAVGIVLAWQEPAGGDSTIDGFHRKSYQADTVAYNADKTLIQDFFLKPKLAKEDRDQVSQAISRIRALRVKWEANPVGGINYKNADFYNRLKPGEKMPWQDKYLAAWESELKNHP
jgi:hypothetical protein